MLEWQCLRQGFSVRPHYPRLSGISTPCSVSNLFNERSVLSKRLLTVSLIFYVETKELDKENKNGSYNREPYHKDFKKHINEKAGDSLEI